MKKIFLALSTSFVFSPLFCLPAFAFPFKENPDSFAAYASSLNWGRGRRLYFYNFDDCGRILFQPDNYACSMGYLNISDPTGTQVCRISIAYASVTKQVFYETEYCRQK